mmetsp:Transcript_10504/g.23910  ORF Transcript_10504/g.23910 Transcript_10504/m.23910 type:complete len:135 (-) Transcript_10504:30-434(-)
MPRQKAVPLKSKRPAKPDKVEGKKAQTGTESKATRSSKKRPSPATASTASASRHNAQPAADADLATIVDHSLAAALCSSELQPLLQQCGPEVVQKLTRALATSRADLVGRLQQSEGASLSRSEVQEAFRHLRDP